MKNKGSGSIIGGIILLLIVVSIIQGIVGFFRGQFSAFNVIVTLAALAAIVGGGIYIYRKMKGSSTPPYRPTGGIFSSPDKWPEEYRPGTKEIEEADAYFLRTVKYHAQPQQFARFQRALDPAQSGLILAIDREKKAALIQSSTSRALAYRTNLYRCTCPDYERNRPAPCKHIYNLALELGIITPDWDLSGLSPETKEKLTGLKVTHRRAFYTLMNEYSKTSTFTVKTRQAPAALVAGGFLVEHELPDEILDTGFTKEDLLIAVKPDKRLKNISGKRKEELIATILSETPDLAERLCSQFRRASFSEKTLEEWDAILKYLQDHRE